MFGKLKEFNDRLSNATKDITLGSFFPLLLYFLVFSFVDLYCIYFIMTTLPPYFEDALKKMVVSNIIALSSLIFMLPKKASAVTFGVVSFLTLGYGFAQLCYSSWNNSIFRLKTILSAKEGFKYMGDILKSLPSLSIILFFAITALIALSVFLVLKFYFPAKNKLAVRAKYIVALIMFIPSAVIVALIPQIKSSDFEESYGGYGSYNYTNLISATDLYKDNDIFILIQRDMICSLKQALSSGNDSSINKYFSSRPPHEDNDKTGIFKDKNLIVVQMESLDYTGLTEEFCPNLYKFMNEGISFENFYSSRFADTYTFGAETAVNTGLFAPGGTDLCSDFVNNAFPYSLARLFTDKGFSANEFHFNTPDFYNRGVMHKVFGFENYIRFEDYAEDKTLDFELDDTVVTDNGLYNKLTENERFLNYIVTYSAHGPYTVTDPIYTEAIRRYPQFQATSSEKAALSKEIMTAKSSITDDMAGKLVERLEEDGLMDDTVILFFADHYAPLGGYDDEQETRSRTPCFIYAKGITPEKVQKVCNTSDILPTVANLFDLGSCDNYVGYDIFDDNYEGIAFFQDLSWIDKDGRIYYSKDPDQSILSEGFDKDYVNKMNDLVKQRIEVNNTILFLDYYKEKEVG